MKKEQKKCSKCLRVFPATRGYFSSASKASGSKLHSWCKFCQRKRGKAQTPILNEHRRVRVITDPLRKRGQNLRAGMVERSRLFGIPFDREFFTSEYMIRWLEQTPNCACCGVLFLTDFRKLGKALPHSPTVERFNPALGYIQGNVALICFRCNTLKRDATIEELEKVLAWMRAFSERRA